MRAIVALALLVASALAAAAKTSAPSARAALPAGPTAVPDSSAAKPAAPAVPPAPPPLAGPCAALVKAIRPGSTDPDAFLAVAACIRTSARPADTAAPETARDSAAIHVHLRPRLPAAETWYTAHLGRLRARRDLAKLEDMAWLAALRDPSGPEVWREIAESHVLAGRFLEAAIAHLKQAEKDPPQAGYAQYPLDNLIRTLPETPPAVFLDSLTFAYRHRNAATAELLETQCWAHRNVACAYVHTSAWLALGHPDPGTALERANRYHMNGYFDYADRLLERAGWRRWPKPMQAMGRALFIRIRYQLEDWDAIAAETAGLASAALSEEEEYIAAAAALRLGKPADALNRLVRFDAPGESQWGYRGQLLKARAQLAQGRLPDAAKTLDALKRSPRRREGTGPILFWQGWLALQQGRPAAAESLLVLASAYTGDIESQRALEFRHWLLLDSAAPRADFFRGLAESPLPAAERIRALDRVPSQSPLWPHARIEKAQILAGQGNADSARAVLDEASKRSQDRISALRAEALAAFLQEKSPGGRSAALARYENLLIQYQQGVVPEFSRGRIRALK